MNTRKGVCFFNRLTVQNTLTCTSNNVWIIVIVTMLSVGLVNIPLCHGGTFAWWGEKSSYPEVSALNMEDGLYKAFVRIFEMAPDRCDNSECVKIEDHPVYAPPAFIYYRTTKSGHWYFGEHMVDDTFAGMRNFSFGKWVFRAADNDGKNAKIRISEISNQYTQ